MNCDEAFEFLTDNHLRHHPALQRHLDRCPRCREMQLTLEPALTLFDRATEGDEFVALDHNPIPEPAAPNTVWDAPWRSQPGDSAPTTIARSRAHTHETSGEGPFWNRRILGVAVRYAAVFIAGALMTFGAISNPLRAQSCLWRQHQQHLAEINRSQPETVVLACVDCHRQLSNVRTAERQSHHVVLQCVACHYPSEQSLETSLNPTLDHDSMRSPTIPANSELMACFWQQATL